jgi:hypothetical protein
MRLFSSSPEKRAQKEAKRAEAAARVAAWKEQRAAERERSAAHKAQKNADQAAAEKAAVARHVLPGETVIEVFEGTMGARYILTDSRLLEMYKDGTPYWATNLADITGMDFDTWGDLHVTFGNHRHKIALKSESFSARSIGERVMNLIAATQSTKSLGR